MSLRTRLSLVTVLVAALALLAANVAVYELVGNYLEDRFDERVNGLSGLTLRSLLDPNRSIPRAGERLEPARSSLDLAGAYGEVRSASGDVIAHGFLLPFRHTRRGPELPPGELKVTNGQTRFFDTTTPSSSGGVPYRVRVASLPQAAFGLPQGVVLITALPANELRDTKHQVVLIELLASGVVVALGLGLTWWLVGLGLRPLRRIEATAERIAEGDLSQRVEPAGGRTEIERLGTSLNSMLGEIESAFAAKETLEDTLRRFVADASHELRTPLTSIRGYAELLRRGADADPAERLAAARRIEEEARRMGVLVSDLLLLARLDEGVPLARESVDLVRIAQDVVHDARVVENGRSITVAAPTSLVITGDRDRLVQVVTNLLVNARGHTPAGSPVEVRVSRDGDAVLEVVDHGPGVDAAVADHIFDRFWRADDSRSREHGGAGLGLSIVAAVVAAHHGHAEVGVTPGGGATFRIRLPLDDTAKRSPEATVAGARRTREADK